MQASLKKNRASLQASLSWNTLGEITGRDCAASFAGIGSRAAAQLRKCEPVEGQKPKTNWRSPMKAQDVENRSSPVDQRHRTRNPFDVMECPQSQ